MPNAADNLPDDVLQLILEDKKTDAVRALRAQIPLPLTAVKDLVWQAEEELGLLQDACCPRCTGAGTIRVRKAEYDPTGRHAEYREENQ